ncbi:MAG: helix-turn-helix domain-containing protein [Pseudomonadales bacterium]|nr:helix-turn-helix domain-containing protein [Pseudomonadales bacterium]
MNQINIWKDKVSFMGNFPTADWHTHGAPVLFIGVSGDFTIEFKDGVKERCKSAFVDAGIAHKTYPNGELMALYYLEPYSLQSLQLKALFLDQVPYQLNVLKVPTNKNRFERALQDFDIEHSIAHELPNIECNFDERVCKSLDLIHESTHPQDRATIASSVNLSSSRFNHLFSEKLNVSYRQYRQWAQLGKALLHYQQNKNLTQASLMAGFSDASHFSNTHKKLLGISPSSVLKKNTTLNVID